MSTPAFDSLLSEFRLSNPTKDLVHCPAPIVYSAVEDNEIPEVEVSIVGQDIFLNFYKAGSQKTDWTSTGTGSTIKHTASTITAINSFCHDFSLNYLTSEMDMSLRSAMDPEVQGFRRLAYEISFRDQTPDYICLKDEPIIVFEFGTVSSQRSKDLERYFQEKADKYRKGLIRYEALNKQVLLAIMIVGQGTIMSNLNLDDEMVEELCFRYRTAQLALRQTMQQGINVGAKQVEQEVRRSYVKGCFTRVPFNWPQTEEKFPLVTQEMYLKTLEPLSEAQTQYVEDLILKSTERATQNITKNHFVQLSDVSKRDANTTECKMAVVQHYLNRAEQPTRCPTHKKRVVNLPLWVLQPTRDQSLDLEEGKLVKTLDPVADATGEVWAEALYRYFMLSSEEKDDHFKDHLEIEMSRSLEFGSEDLDATKHLRSKRNRIRVPLRDSLKESLATTGLYGKKFAREKMPTEQERKKGMSMYTDVSDITNFIESAFDELGIDEPYTNGRVSDYEDLISAALAVHGNNKGDWFERAISKFFRCRLSLWSQMLADTAHELSLSMSQNCRENEFILKKLRHWDVWLLVVSSGSSKALKFSMLTLRASLLNGNTWEGLFSKSHSDGHYVWTEFTTVNESKLENWLKFDSICLSQFFFWGEMYLQPFWKLEDDVGMSEILPRGEALKMWENLSLTLLVALEDKSKTEQTGIAARFLMLEGFVMFPNVPKPHKMFPKLPSVVRSRLQLWLELKLLNAALRIVEVGGFKPRSHTLEDGNVIHWDNLFNPYTGEQLTDMSILVNLIYLTYVKNKNELPEKNQGVKMIEKIMEYEKELPTDTRYLGKEDPDFDDIGFHEYSLSLIKYISRTSTNVLKRSLGPDVLSQLENTILDKLYDHDIEEMSSLKASSNFSQEWEVYDRVKSLKDRGVFYTRRRVVEAFMDYREQSDLKLMDLAQRALEDMESDGCLRCDIFKKAQHGDIREIYVLDIKARIVQLVLETIGRGVCSLFASETMTHPENKMKLVHAHHKRSRRSYGTRYMTLSTSDDAQKWSQSHFVPKFAQFLTLFTPTYMHPFIWRACSLFTNKKIMMDLSILEACAKHITDFKSSSATYTEIFNIFSGKLPSQSWYQRGNTYLKTRSGMFQGILHYVSSAFHACYLETYRSLCINAFKRNMDEGVEDETAALVTYLVSSDDSSVLISFDSGSSHRLRKGLFLSSTMFEMKKVLGNYLGILSSVKCTSNTPWFVEFNSEYYVWKDVVRPVLKWVHACLVSSESESLGGRQEEQSSNLTSLLGSGASFSLCCFVQMAQALVFYKFLGMFVSPTFRLASQLLLEVKDPSLGFFLLDDPTCAGLTGLKYNVWKLVCNEPIGKVYCQNLEDQMSMQSEETLVRRRITWETSQSGMILQSVCLFFMGKSKWDRVRQRMSLPEDFENYFDEHPEKLFERAKTEDELLNKQAMLFYSPGVVRSMGGQVTLSRQISAAAYLLTRPVLVDRLSVVDNQGERYSLLRKLLMVKNDIEATQEDEMCYHKLQQLFPFSLDYQQLDGQLRRTGHASIFFKTNIRRRALTEIRVTDSLPDATLNAEKLARNKWFGSDIRISRTTRDYYWALLKETIPWLCDDPHDTLARSPFIHQSQLRNFLSRLDHKRRQVTILSEPMRKVYGLSNMKTMMHVHFYPGYRFGHPNEGDDVEEIHATNRMLNVLTLLSRSYCTTKRKSELAKVILSKTKDTHFTAGQFSSRKNALSVLAALARPIMRGQLRPDVIQYVHDRIFRLRLGVIGGITQKFDKRTLVGSLGKKTELSGTSWWEGYVDGTSVKIIIGLVKENDRTKSIITAVIISKAINIDSIRYAIMELTNSFRWEWPTMAPPIIYLSPATIIYKINRSGVFNRNSPQGVPIFLMPEYAYSFQPDLIVGLDIVCTRRSIDVMAKLTTPQGPEEGNEVKVFSLPLKNHFITRDYQFQDQQYDPGEVTSLTSTFTTTPFLGHWLKFQAAPPTAVISAIKKSQNWRIDDYEVDQEALIRLLRECFNSSLMRQGILTKSELITGLSNAAQETTPQVYERTRKMDVWAIWKKFTEAELLEEALVIPEGVPEVEHEAVVTDDITDRLMSADWQNLLQATMDTFAKGETAEHVSVESIQHPLMDDFVSQLVDYAGREQLARLVRSKTFCPSSLSSLTSVLATLLDVSESQLIVTQPFEFDSAEQSHPL